MQAAICTGFDDTPYAPSLLLIRQAGFGVISLGPKPQHSGYGTATGRGVIRALLKAHGLTMNSVHAPFPEGDRLFSLDETERRESIRQCRIAMEAAAELEGRIVVLHLIQPYDIPHGDVWDRMVDQGRRSMETLTAEAIRLDVRLALENGQRADYDQVVADFLTEFDDAAVGLCYDSGHEFVRGACFTMLERFGHRLLTLHLHDNTGSDSHLLPYEGALPWDAFCSILRRLPYTGPLQLEVGIANSHFQEPAVFLAQARSRVERLLRELTVTGE